MRDVAKYLFITIYYVFFLTQSERATAQPMSLFMPTPESDLAGRIENQLEVYFALRLPDAVIKPVLEALSMETLAVAAEHWQDFDLKRAAERDYIHELNVLQSQKDEILMEGSLGISTGSALAISLRVERRRIGRASRLLDILSKVPGKLTGSAKALELNLKAFNNLSGISQIPAVTYEGLMRGYMVAQSNGLPILLDKKVRTDVVVGAVQRYMLDGIAKRIESPAAEAPAPFDAIELEWVRGPRAHLKIGVDGKLLFPAGEPLLQNTNLPKWVYSNSRALRTSLFDYEQSLLQMLGRVMPKYVPLESDFRFRAESFSDYSVPPHVQSALEDSVHRLTRVAVAKAPMSALIDFRNSGTVSELARKLRREMKLVEYDRLAQLSREIPTVIPKEFKNDRPQRVQRRTRMTLVGGVGGLGVGAILGTILAYLVEDEHLTALVPLEINPFTDDGLDIEKGFVSHAVIKARATVDLMRQSDPEACSEARPCSLRLPIWREVLTAAVNARDREGYSDLLVTEDQP